MRAYQMLRSLPETALNFARSTPSEELCLSQSAGRAVNQYFKDIYLNIIFIPNPDIASWQFPPVKHIMKKSGFIELHVRENEPFRAFTPNYLKCGYIINRSYHKSFIHFQLYQGQASNVFAASPLI